LVSVAQATSVPPCTPITLRASGVTGRPPLQTFWTLPGGGRVRSNPARFDPGPKPPGLYTATFTAINSAGRASRSVSFTIESLRFRKAPHVENLGQRQVRVSASTEGAVELQWIWGDGTTSSWLALCDGLSQTHRYPSAGTYTLRARARNCRDPILESPPVAIEVTSQPEPKILAFAAQGCTLGFCLFAPGVPIFFDQRFDGSPTAYLYDWDGNGTFEEVSGVPVPSHAYGKPGVYLPVLKVTSGPLSATFRHAAPILVQSNARR
ncbi:MAG TPA: hypothetical protein VN783_03840, partial [Thermoanaerobaculia bacterium]|nr:hypothetical protein [Thermoanaerobaculia bacterium]